MDRYGEERSEIEKIRRDQKVLLVDETQQTLLEIPKFVAKTNGFSAPFKLLLAIS